MSSGSCRKRKREDDSLGPEKQKQKESCPICLDSLGSEISESACGHKFHQICLEKWSKRRQGHRCPMCRKSIITGEVCELRDTSEWFQSRSQSDDFQRGMNSILELCSSNDNTMTRDQV